MSQSKSKTIKQRYDSLMLRSAFVSLFWAIISDLKQRRAYKLQQLADEIGVDKSVVSRWFSGAQPNWTLNTIGEIASALNVDITIQAVDRASGEVYRAHGPISHGPLNVRTGRIEVKSAGGHITKSKPAEPAVGQVHYV